MAMNKGMLDSIINRAVLGGYTAGRINLSFSIFYFYFFIFLSSIQHMSGAKLAERTTLTTGLINI
jgi:hypothetical protein